MIRSGIGRLSGDGIRNEQVWLRITIGSKVPSWIVNCAAQGQMIHGLESAQRSLTDGTNEGGRYRENGKAACTSKRDVNRRTRVKFQIKGTREQRQKAANE